MKLFIECIEEFGDIVQVENDVDKINFMKDKQKGEVTNNDSTCSSSKKTGIRSGNETMLFLRELLNFEKKCMENLEQTTLRDWLFWLAMPKT